MKDYDHYVDSIPVDRRNLSDELTSHVELMSDVTRHATMLRHQVDVTKQELARIEAEAAISIRADAAVSGKKLTVDAVKDAVTTDPAVRDAYDKCLDAKGQAEKWTALAEAYKQRGYAMRELTELLTIEMMSDPGTIANRRVTRLSSK